MSLFGVEIPPIFFILLLPSPIFKIQHMPQNKHAYFSALHNFLLLFSIVVMTHESGDFISLNVSVQSSRQEYRKLITAQTFKSTRYIPIHELQTVSFFGCRSLSNKRVKYQACLLQRSAGNIIIRKSKLPQQQNESFVSFTSSDSCHVHLKNDQTIVLIINIKIVKRRNQPENPSSPKVQNC